MDALSKGLDRPDLQDTKVFAFKPSISDDGRKTQLDPIPRYLSRVFDSSSPGKSNEIWVKSKDAVRQHPNAEIDFLGEEIKPRQRTAFGDTSAGKVSRKITSCHGQAFYFSQSSISSTDTTASGHGPLERTSRFASETPTPSLKGPSSEILISLKLWLRSTEI